MAIMDLHRGDVQTDIQGGVEFSFSKDAAAASKLYQMMSNYLYSDKEYAVVSELAANAVDAHAMVDRKDLPIYVQLPTKLESEFVVRDYGPGMPEEDVYRFLTSYGESSKGGTNDQIGFWGIGSKSPAAVSDSWSVISHHAGKRTHYEVFITEAGIPTLKKIFEGESDETGLEVRVPVSMNAHQQWRNAAVRAFKHYTVKPNFNIALDFPKVAYQERGTGWGRGVPASGFGRVLIAMREYPLDYSKVMAEVPPGSPIRHLYGAGWAGFDFKFNVGDINLSISREQIQYDKKSIESILTKLETVYNEFKALVDADLNASMNSLDYRRRVLSWYEKGCSSIFLNHVVNKKYGITNLPADVQRINAPFDFEKNRLQVISNSRMKKVDDRFSCWGTNVISSNSRWNGSTSEYDFSVGLNIAHLARIVVVIRDVHDTVSRIKHSGSHGNFYLIVDESPFTDEITPVLGSSFAKPPRVSKASERGELSGFYAIKGGRFLKIDADEFVEHQKTENTTAVKILNATTAVNEATVVGDKNVEFLRGEGWTIIGYKDKPPKGVKTPAEGVKFLFDKLSVDPELKKDIENNKFKEMFRQVGMNSTTILAAKLDIVSPKWNDLVAPMQPVIDYYKAHKSPLAGSYSSIEYRRWLRVCSLLSVDDKTSGTVDLSKMSDLIEKRYPMLKYVHQGWFGQVSSQDTICDYIKMVDDKN